MAMTDEQKYSAVLKELGEVLASKNSIISWQDFEIEQIKKKLAAAEAERDAAMQKNAAENYLLIDSNGIDVLREINAELRAHYETLSATIGRIEPIEELQRALAHILPVNGGAA